MARHSDDHRGPEHPSAPWHPGLGVTSEGAAGVVVLPPQGEMDMAMAAEAEAALAPARGKRLPDA